MHRFRGGSLAAFNFCTDPEEKGTACIYCWHEFREEVRPHLLQIVQYGFGTVFEVNLQHRFRGKVQHVSQGSSFYFRHRFRGRTAAFNAVRTVRPLTDFWVCFGTKIENSSLLFMHRNRGRKSSDFQAVFRD